MNCNTNNCKQGRVPCPTPNACGTLTTGNGGNVINEGQPLPRRQFEPDYEIEHIKVSYRPTPLAYCLAIFSIVMFVISVFRHV